MTLILFRCEFGTQYGFGHLMRCIALAQAFQEKNQVQTFCFSSSCIDGFNELFDNANMTYIQLPRIQKGCYLIRMITFGYQVIT